MELCGTTITRKGCYKAFGLAAIITITALIVVIVSNNNNNRVPNEGYFVSDEYEEQIGQDNPSAPEGCYPIPDTKVAQFIIGYGSLMQSDSKRKTYPNTSENIPILVHGFNRLWNMEGTKIGFGTTYLGVEKSNGSTINGVVFRLPPSSDIVAAMSLYDSRELYYCRVEIPPKNIEILTNTTDAVEVKELMNSTEKSSQFWIYYSRPANSKKPSARYPIVQSYVDVFISGCIELEHKFNLTQFEEKCITLTQDWGPHWVNDRTLPRRSHVGNPMAPKIDTLLAKLLPEQFKRIKIEG